MDKHTTKSGRGTKAALCVAGLCLAASGVTLVANGAGGPTLSTEATTSSGATSQSSPAVVAGGGVSTPTIIPASPPPAQQSAGAVSVATTPAAAASPDAVLATVSTSVAADPAVSALRPLVSTGGTNGSSTPTASGTGGAAALLGGMSTHGTSTVAALPGVSNPQGVTVAGGIEYVSDTGGDTVRALDLSTGAVSVVAGDGNPGYSGDGGAATAAELTSPDGLAVTNGVLYVADQFSSVIRAVDLATGIITTVAGNGTVGYSGDGGLATAAALADPQALSAHGSTLYIADLENHAIRAVDLTTGIITTVAGSGTQGYSGDGGAATAAHLYYPQGVAVSPDGNTLYIADTFNNVIRAVDLTTGIITTVAGNGTGYYSGDGGAATAAELNSPSDVVVSPDGNTLYVTDTYNSAVRVVDLTSGNISSLALTGSTASVNLPYGLAISPDGSTIYVADTGDSQMVSVLLG